MTAFSIHITCTALNDLLGYATRNDHAGAHQPTRLQQLATMTALHSYAQLQSVDKTFIPLPDNGQLDKDWLAECLPKTWRIDYLSPQVFAAKYPQFATWVPGTPPPPPAAEIDARA
jgi:hypothetical protein